MVAAVLRERARPPLPMEASEWRGMGERERDRWRGLVEACWAQAAEDRPSFSGVVVALQEMGAAIFGLEFTCVAS